MSKLDAISVIESVSPDAIRKCLLDLEREEAALRVLLRAALARQRQTAAMQRLQRGKADVRRVAVGEHEGKT